jgi:formate--tetrahydrofolate ligase
LPTDIEIARQVSPLPIMKVAERLGIAADELIPYGHTKAKISPRVYERLRERPDGKLILVTAINPTPAGEGKTTTSVGLGDALRRLGRSVCVALREPSLGPVFGSKGGAAGGGWAQVVPMEDLNLHFTGDMHAVSSAHNLLSAMLDNHIYQGNALDIDPETITWRRVMDMNDRQLRRIQSGLGNKGGIPRADGFDITAASEIMAVFCLASDLRDLERRLARILVARTRDGRPVTAGDLHAAGAMAVLLRDAFAPNLVQTLEHTPVFVHGGPFANIAHGCNSIVATRLALKLADYVVTEAGFGADLGAEKFMDIVCPAAGFAPSAVVIVASVRALKYHGGVGRDGLTRADPGSVQRGAANLEKHIENMTGLFARPVIVAINRFATDTDAEIAAATSACRAMGVPVEVCDVWSRGGAGGEALAREVLRLTGLAAPPLPRLYDPRQPIREKIRRIVVDCYGGGDVAYTPEALRAIDAIEAMGYADLPVCMAKTQYSLSDCPRLVGRPRGFTLRVRDVRVSAGAGFLVALTGTIMTMPGLPAQPAANTIGMTPEGLVYGLF